MIYVCVICMVKRPPLLLLTSEHRKILEAIVSPVINTTELKACRMLLCAECRKLMESVHTFQQAALAGVRNLQRLLWQLHQTQTVPELATVSVKEEPEALPEKLVTKEEIYVNEAPILNSLTEEVDIKVESIVVPKTEYNAVDTGSTLSFKFDNEGPADIPTILPVTRCLESGARKHPNELNPLTEEVHIRIEIEAESKSESEYVGSRATLSCESDNGDRSDIPMTVPVTRCLQSNARKRSNTATAAPRVTKALNIPQAPGPGRSRDTGFASEPDALQGQISINIDPVPTNPKRRRIRKRPPRVPVKCEICNRTCHDKNGLRVHLKRMHSESPVACDVCGKQCRNEHVLKTHKTTHRAEDRTIDNLRTDLFCAECQWEFNSKGQFKQHMMSLKHSSRDQWEFECETCHRKFPTGARRQDHINNVHLNMKHKCTECEKSYAKHSGLRYHIKKEHDKTAEKTSVAHMCDLCGATFTASKSLKEHILRHSGARPQRCPLCPAVFTYKAALYTHNRLKHLNWKKTKKKRQEPTDKAEKRSDENTEN